MLLATAALIGFGWLNKVNQFIAEKINLTSTPTAALEQRALQDMDDTKEVDKSKVLDLSPRQLALSGYPEFEEFNFEKDPDNVGKAVRDFGIRYPVALDPEYETWDNFYNRYWPAHYLIDRDGHLRAVHYGEGAYGRTENQVRSLLALPAMPASDEGTSNLRS